MDIRIFSKLAAAVAMLLTIASCNKTEMANTGAAVGYSVGIAGADGSKATAGTKAVLFNSATDIQQNGNSFACSAYNETKKTSLYTGETVTYNGTKWDTTTPYNWQPGETLTFHAVYPASAAGTGDGKAVIAADGTGISIANFTVADDAKDQNDILLGKYSGAGKTTGNPDGTAVISFQHPFTAVRFVMGDIADYIPGFTGISSITISDVHSSGTLAKWNGGAFSWTPSEVSKTVTLNVGGANPARTAAIKGTDANAEAFTLIPQNLSTNPATITINYNATVDGSIVATVSKVSETTTAWEAGNVYTYTVNYKTLPLTITTFVTDWGEADNIGKELEEVQPTVIKVTVPAHTTSLCVSSLGKIDEATGQRGSTVNPINPENNTTTINITGISDSSYEEIVDVEILPGVLLADLNFDTGKAQGGFSPNSIRQEGKDPLTYAVEEGKSYSLAASCFHDYVTIDNKKWATMNIGAANADDYGDYFAWGATAVNYTLSGDTFSFFDSPIDQNADGSKYDMTLWEKSPYGSGFCPPNSPYLEQASWSSKLDEWDIISYKKYGSNERIELCDDTANAAWGGAWRMPNNAEFSSILYSGTYSDGKFTVSKGGKTISFPAAGIASGTKRSNTVKCGWYWSSLADTSEYAKHLYFDDSGNRYVIYSGRYVGYSVRAISD